MFTTGWNRASLTGFPFSHYYTYIYIDISTPPSFSYWLVEHVMSVCLQPANIHRVYHIISQWHLLMILLRDAFDFILFWSAGSLILIQRHLLMCCLVGAPITVVPSRRISRQAAAFIWFYFMLRSALYWSRNRHWLAAMMARPQLCRSLEEYPGMQRLFYFSPLFNFMLLTALYWSLGANWQATA